MSENQPPAPHRLSPRALCYLSTLERLPAVPTEEVEALLLRSGQPCFAPWLEFHERYAGYHDTISLDHCIWGLAHRESYCLSPNRVYVEQGEFEGKWEIVCADVHPSYNYQLDEIGIFLGGGQAESFDIHVERIALSRMRPNTGRLSRFSAEELRSPAVRQLFEGQIKPHLVPEASDRFWRYYLTDKYFMQEDAETGEFYRGGEFKPQSGHPPA